MFIEDDMIHPEHRVRNHMFMWGVLGVLMGVATGGILAIGVGAGLGLLVGFISGKASEHYYLRNKAYYPHPVTVTTSSGPAQAMDLQMDAPQRADGKSYADTVTEARAVAENSKDQSR